MYSLSTIWFPGSLIPYQHLVFAILSLAIPVGVCMYADRKATVRTGHGTTDWFQIEKEYVRAVYYHPAYLTSMQSTS